MSSPQPTQLTVEQYRAFLQEHFPRRNKALYQLDPSIFAPTFLEAIKKGTPGALRGLLREEIPEVYLFEMLRLDFCEQLIEEADWFNEWCVANELHKNVPNTMNNYGAVLDDFGFHPMLREFMVKYISPLASLLYPDVGGGTLSDHHGFLVDYEMGKDESLDFHVDASEVTLNVCLGKEFEGGPLYFGGIRCRVCQQTAPLPGEEVEIHHSSGTALLHRGKHRHAAKPITSGRRCNLIMWCMSEEYQAAYQPNKCQSWCGYRAVRESNLGE